MEEFIVAVLSVLVAILLSVQFYNVFDINRKFKQYRQVVKKVDEKSENISTYAKANLAYSQAFILLLLLTDGTCNRKDENILSCYDAFLKALRGYVKSSISDFKEIEATATNALKAAKFSNNERTISDVKKNILDEIYECSHINKIKLMKLVNEIEKAAPKGSGPGA